MTASSTLFLPSLIALFASPTTRRTLPFFPIFPVRRCRYDSPFFYPPVSPFFLPSSFTSHFFSSFLLSRAVSSLLYPATLFTFSFCSPFPFFCLTIPPLFFSFVSLPVPLRFFFAHHPSAFPLFSILQRYSLRITAPPFPLPLLYLFFFPSPLAR